MLFHFRLIEGGRGDTADDGVDLPGLAAAVNFAIAQARDILAADILIGVLPLHNSIEIIADDGTVVATIPFSAAISIRTK